MGDDFVGPLEQTSSFNLSDWTNAFKSTVTELTGTYASVKSDLAKAGVIADTRQDAAVKQQAASNSTTLLYLGLGLAVIYFLKRG